MRYIEVLRQFTPVSTTTGVSNNMLMEEVMIFSYVSSP
jgi:hypothetical protein